VTFAEAVAWISRLAALAAGIAALELAWVHRAWRTGPLARATRPAAGRRRLADLAFGARGTATLVALLLGSALVLPWTESSLPAWLAAGATLGLSVRFRGTYNGGSDAMLLVVLLALALVRTDPRLALAGLGYAAVHLVLSYAISGVAKLREPRWRDGTALDTLVRLPQYGVPPRLIAILTRPAAKLATFAMLGFECAFPIALLDPTVCVVALVGAAVFHLVNAIVFGLNRFLWAWLAAFPALLFWVERLHA
jgi:hypothetical protein